MDPRRTLLLLVLVLVAALIWAESGRDAATSTNVLDDTASAPLAGDSPHAVAVDPQAPEAGQSRAQSARSAGVAAVRNVCFGLVVDEDDEPVEAASVRAFAGRDARLLAHTDVGGRFRCPVDAAGTMLGAHKPGYAPSELITPVGLLRKSVPLRFVLRKKRGRVAGTVVDPAGKPVPHASVRVKDVHVTETWVSGIGSSSSTARSPIVISPDGNVHEGGQPLSGQCDSEGRFVFEDVAQGWNKLEAAHLGFATQCVMVNSNDDRSSRLRVVLAPGVSVGGTVRDAQGRPIARAIVEVDVTLTRLLAGHSAGLDWLRTRTDGRGRYRFADLRPGNVRLRAFGKGAGTCDLEFQHRAGHAERDLTLRRSPAITGRLVDERGRGVPGFHVLAVPLLTFYTPDREPRTRAWRTAVTRDDGSFEIPGLQNLAHRLEIRRDPDDVLPLWVRTPVSVSDREFVIRVDSRIGPGIRGRVVAPDGEALAGAEILVWLGQHEIGRVASRGPQGAFDTGPLRPAGYRLEVRAAGFPRAFVDAGRTAKLDGGAIALPRACKLEIVATRVDGKLLRNAGVTVTPRSPVDAKPVYVRRTSDTTFAVPAQPLAAGSYTVTVKAANARTLSYPLRLTPDKTARAVLVLVPK